MGNSHNPKLCYSHIIGMLSKRLYVAIGMLSAAIIAFQLTLMQYLSFVQWGHFAYMVISVALLGFGASGTMLSLFRTLFVRRYTTLLPILFALCSVFMTTELMLTQSITPRFNPFMVISGTREIGALMLMYLLYILPFFFGGAAIGLVYTKHSSHIGGLYFADLSGAAIGGILLSILLWMLPPWQLSPLLSLLPLAGAFLVIDYHNRRKTVVLLMACTVLSGYLIVNKQSPAISEYKSLSKAMSMQGSTIILTRNSPYGQLHVVSSEVIRHAPGLSLCATQQPPKAMMLFNNGNWFGAIPLDNASERTLLYDYTLYSLPFSIGTPDKVLLLDAGSAPFAPYCLTKGAKDLTLVEPNALATEVLKGELASVHDSLLYDPRITVKQNSSRSYLLSDTTTYNLIVFPDVGSIDGMSGMLAANEQPLLTIEGVKDGWNRLSKDGYLMYAAWLDYPPRVMLKLLTTIKTILVQEGISMPEQHVAVARSWSNAVLLVKRSPLLAAEIDSIQLFCKERCFDPILPKSIRPKEGDSFNVLKDNMLESFCDSIIYGDPQQFQNRYLLNVSPSTDNQPYFYRFFKPTRYNELREQMSLEALIRIEPGYFFVFITLAQIFAAALILTIVPLLFLKVKTKGIWLTLLYFSGLGIGFMFMEIVLIQQLTLYLGQPIYAAAAVISLLLLFSGIGSITTERFTADRSTMLKVFTIIILSILAYSIGVELLLRSTISLPMAGKLALTIALIGMPALAMGMAFPLGIKLLSEHNRQLVPWAWGVNSCASVVSTVMATGVALHAGFQVVMMVAAAAYTLSLVAVALWRK